MTALRTQRCVAYCQNSPPKDLSSMTKPIRTGVLLYVDEMIRCCAGLPMVVTHASHASSCVTATAPTHTTSLHHHFVQLLQRCWPTETLKSLLQLLVLTRFSAQHPRRGDFAQYRALKCRCALTDSHSTHQRRVCTHSVTRRARLHSLTHPRTRSFTSHTAHMQYNVGQIRM